MEPHKELPRLVCTDPREFRETLAFSPTPVIVRGLVERWPAYRAWSLPELTKRYGHLAFRIATDLPRDQTPYDFPAEEHVREMTFAEAVELLQDESCSTYVRRQHLEKFAGAMHDVQIDLLSPEDGKPKNFFLWLGRSTLTGLHFDFTQGILCQLAGTKSVYLAPQNEAKNLHPIKGGVTKSRFLPSQPDYQVFPKARAVTFWKGVLEPGELLVIPRLWWHSVVSEEISLSISHDFGRNISTKELIGLVAAGGPAQVVHVLRDFLFYGVLGHPFSRRLTDDPPFGRLVFEMLSFSLRKQFAKH